MAGNKRIAQAKSLLLDTLELSILCFNNLRENRGEGGVPPHFGKRQAKKRAGSGSKSPRRSQKFPSGQVLHE